MASLVLFYMRGGFSAVHLKKDVGLFPKYLQKEYFDSARIVKIGTDDKTDYSSSNLLVEDLFYEPRVNESSFQQSKKFEIKCLIKCFKYLLKHKDLTHIMIFNLTRFSVGLAFLVKVFLHGRKIYLKLDANTDISRRLSENSKKLSRKTFLKLISFVDIISVETEQNYEIIKQNPYIAKKLFLVPNGFEKPFDWNIDKKENIILTVGSLGLPVKNTDVLLESVKKIDFKDWKFYFTGPVEDCFQKKVIDFYKENPELKEKIIFTGAVYDSKELANLYIKSKVFILPSEYESFGIATIEAASYGDYLILTDTGVARDIIQDENFGCILNENDSESQNKIMLVEEIAMLLQKIIDGKIDTDKNIENRIKVVNGKFLMENIVNLPVFKEWAR